MKKHILTLSMVALMAGCTTPVSQWSEEQSLKKNKVEQVTRHHFIQFANLQGRLNDVEIDKLQKFIADCGVPYRLYIRLEFADDGKASHKDFEQQASFVAHELTKIGIPEHHISAVLLLPHCVLNPSNLGGINVVVDTYMVIPPRCPDFSSPEANFGCATATNLGLQVANPRDLMYGSGNGSFDGERHALSVNRYRKDEVKELKIQQVGGS